MFFSTLLLTLGSLAAGSPVAKRGTLCNKFTPAPREQWDESAHTPTVNVSAVKDCTQSHSACPIPHSEQINNMAVYTSTQEITPALKENMLKEGFDKIFAPKYWFAVAWFSPEDPNEEVDPNDSRYTFWVDPGTKGYVGFTCGAAIIPGQFSECDDGVDRQGSMTVPRLGSAAGAVVPTTEN